MYGKDDAILILIIVVIIGAYITAFYWQKGAGDQIKASFKIIFDKLNLVETKIKDIIKRIDKLENQGDSNGKD